MLAIRRAFYINERRMYMSDLRKLNVSQAETFDRWLRHNGYDPHNMTLRQTIDSAREMSVWFSNMFTYHSPRYLVVGILALQNGGEV